MKLNPNVFGLSLGSVSGIAAFVCGFFVWLSPAATMAFATFWFHTDISGLAAKITAVNFIGSIVISFVFGYAFGWLLAEIYNKTTKN